MPQILRACVLAHFGLAHPRPAASWGGPLLKQRKTNSTASAMSAKPRSQAGDCAHLATVSPAGMQALLHGGSHALQQAAEAAWGKQAAQDMEHGGVLGEEPGGWQPKHPLGEGLYCRPEHQPHYESFVAGN